MTSPGMTPLPSDALAAGDQAEAQVITRGRVKAHVLLTDVGLTMDHLTEDEREILDIGIRCGALAVLALDKAAIPGEPSQPLFGRGWQAVVADQLAKRDNLTTRECSSEEQP